MRHREEFSIRSRALSSQRFALCLALTMAFLGVASSTKAASALTVTPGGLSFVAVEGGSNPPIQSLTIVSSGSKGVSWFATSSVSWIQVIPLTGTTPASAFVSPNVAEMAAGTYTGTILVISRETGVSQVVSVSVTVTPQGTQSQ